MYNLSVFKNYNYLNKKIIYFKNLFKKINLTHKLRKSVLLGHIKGPGG